MLEIILVIIGLIGFGAAGILDLKTTEFYDWIPYGMLAAVFAVRVADSFLVGNFSSLYSAVLTGASFSVLGAILYFTKQWGDGDAWLIGIFGFIFPQNFLAQTGYILPVEITLVFNLFLVSLVYMAAYSGALGAKNPAAIKIFFSHLKRNYKGAVYLSTAGSMALIGGLMYFFYSQINYIVLLPLLLLLASMLFNYMKIIDNHIFRKRVAVSKLKPGDVLVRGRWTGLKKADIQKLRKSYNHVWIKEGIRFSSVFVLAFTVTLVFGNLLLWFV